MVIFAPASRALAVAETNASHCLPSTQHFASAIDRAFVRKNELRPNRRETAHFHPEVRR